MNTDNTSYYVKWLKQEVAPALGCTEPVAISFAAPTPHNIWISLALKLAVYFRQSL